MTLPSFRDCCPASSDKVWGHGYDAVYEELVLPRIPRDAPSVVLEIGVHEGGSLRLWEALLPLAQIHGIDVDPRCVAHARPPRTLVHVGSQADTAFLDQVLDLCAPPHLIVDDGSHDPTDFWASLQHLFPAMREDGVYVVEDVWHEFLPDLLRKIRTYLGREATVRASTSPNRHLVVIYR